jgi:serine/threonine protein kinase/WD40 repeat protein
VNRFQIEPADRDERLGEAVEEFMALAESGDSPDPEEFAARYPDISDDLVEALEGLSLVRGLVGTAGEHGRRLEAGHRLAGYRIVRELGSGGMGVVYEAVHVDLDRPVALKVLDARATLDSNGLRRFQEEAKTAAGLHHTHIVPVFDVGHVGGLCYYAMQRIEGSGLDRVLRSMRRDRSTGAGSGSGRQLSPSRALPSLASAHDVDSGLLSSHCDGSSMPAHRRFADDETPPFVPPRGSAYYRWVAEAGRQAAQALAHAHRRGVIHRDIKPSNLLVDARGTIWVTDFGLARRLENPGLTRTDGLLGTPRYMSPEQATGSAIDGRTDVFSLGATLYELLTLRPPFEGRTAAELIQQIRDRDVAPPRRHDPKVPRDLETIVLKALAKRPADRFLDATELSDDLTRFLKFEPVRARRIGPLGRTWRMARRHPAVAAVTTVAAAVILGIATFAYVRVVQERDRARNAQAQIQVALRKTEAANRATQDAIRRLLLSSASLTRLSSVPNRRERGLSLLAKAASLKPDPALRAQLRDEAVEFLALRDIEARPELPTGRTQGIAFGPMGLHLASVVEEGKKLVLWDVVKREPHTQPVETGPPARVEENHPPTNPRPGDPRLTGPRVASIGPLIAVLWLDGKGVRLFDGSSGAIALDVPMPTHEVAAIYGSSTSAGPRIVTLEFDGEDNGRNRRPTEDSGRNRRPTIVNLWDPMHADEPIAQLARPKPDEPPQPAVVALAPDGDFVATGWRGASPISLWSAKDGRSQGVIDTNGSLTALALSSENLLAAAGPGAVRLWQAETKASLPSLNPHHGFVRLLRFSPDGTLLAIASGGADVEVWDPASNALVAALPTQEAISELAFSPNGRLLAASQAAPPGTTQNSAVSVWAIVDPVVRRRLSGLASPPASLAFSASGVLGIACRFDGVARFWDPSRCPTTAHDSSELPVTAIAADGEGWLAANGSELLRLAGSESTGIESRIPLPAPDRQDGGRPGRPPRDPPVVSIVRTPDGKAIVLARFNDLLVFRPEKSQTIRTISQPRDSSRARSNRGARVPNAAMWNGLALAPTGDRLYTATLGQLQAWSLSGDSVHRLDWNFPIDTVTPIALTPDGRTLAAGERSGGVVLIETSTATVRYRLMPDDATDSQVTALTFNATGQELGVGNKQGQVRLWRLGETSGASIAQLPAHRGAVSVLTFDRTSSRIASAGEDKSVVVWDVDRLQAELKRVDLAW